MKKVKIIWIIVGIILVSCLGIWYFYPSSSDNKITQECSKENGYCIYNNIPSGMKYSEPSEFYYKDENSTIIIKNGKVTNETIVEFDGNLSEYLIRDDTPNRLSEVLGGDWSSYKCVSTNKTPVIIEYFYDLCEGVEGEGCWHERRAVVCGNIYFVQDFTSAYGPGLYGPFEI